MTTEGIVKGQASRGLKCFVILNLIKGYGRLLDGNGGVWAVIGPSLCWEPLWLLGGAWTEGRKERGKINQQHVAVQPKDCGLQGRWGTRGDAAAWGNILKIAQSEFANELDVGILKNGKSKKALQCWAHRRGNQELHLGRAVLRWW